MENQNYKLRGLKTKDIFKASRILSKIEINFSDINTEGLSQAQAGMALVKLVLDNLWKAEDEVNEFIGSLVGLTGEEFAELDLEVTAIIMAQFKELKGLDIFFKSVAKQANQK